MPAGPLTINGTDVATLGFRLSSAPGWLDLPGRVTPSAQRPSRAGAQITGPVVEQPRRLTLNGVVDGSTDVIARTNLDALRALILKTQPAQIILPDNASRFVSGYLEQHTTDVGIGPSMIARTLRAKLDFNLLDPYAYDVALTTVAGTAATAQPLGDAPSRPKFTITFAGTVASVQIFVTNAANTVTYGSITLTGPFTAGQVLVVDMDPLTVTLQGISRLDLITAGDFFALDVATMGDYATSTWPTFRSGTAGTLVFRRAWR